MQHAYLFRFSVKIDAKCACMHTATSSTSHACLYLHDTLLQHLDDENRNVIYHAHNPTGCTQSPYIVDGLSE